MEKIKNKTICILGIAAMVLVSTQVLSEGLSGYNERGRSRIKNTERSRNIYGVKGGFSNSRIYGDERGIARNYFGISSNNSGTYQNSPYESQREYAQTCLSREDLASQPRYFSNFGYEKGLSECEIAEYREFLRQKK